MGNSKIEWTDRTWNVVTGCTKISPGCQNCYAERMSKRLAGRCGYPKDDPFRVTLHPDRLEEPRHWRKPSRIFVCSMGDLFHPDVPHSFIQKVLYTIRLAKQHTFMVLTKRPERMITFFQQYYPEGPIQNLWLGVTAENQEQADKRIPVLLQIPAAIHWVSCEPLLGPINLEWYLRDSGLKAPHWLDWCVAGGESGPGARPLHPDWARSLRDQCEAAEVPFFFKQWGEWYPFYDRDKDDPDWQHVPEENAVSGIRRLNLAGGSGFHGDRVVYLHRAGKKNAGRLLDGREWDEYPEISQ